MYRFWPHVASWRQTWETEMPNSIARRRLLHAGTAASLALAAAAMPRRAAADEAGADDPYQPWRSFDPGQSEPLGMVHAAVLAANAHNTQPWQFCVNADRIDVCADLARNLGAMDPFRREMHLSLGCALQNLVMMADAQGRGPKLALAGGTLAEPKPDAGPLQIASVGLPGGPPVVSPLLAGVPRRHTNRAAYDPDRPVGDALVAALPALADPDSGARLVLLADPKARADFSAATVEATGAIIADAAMIADSDAWFRSTNAEIASHRDGPTIDAAGLSTWMTVLAKILPAPSPERAHGIWLDRTRDVQLATAPLFGLIVVRDLYDRRQALQAGMLWQRLHLRATLAELAAQPINQLPERVDRERQLGLPAHAARTLADLSGDPDWHATFAFRIGWPTRPVGPSPRRELDAVIRQTACAPPA